MSVKTGLKEMKESGSSSQYANQTMILLLNERLIDVRVLNYESRV